MTIIKALFAGFAGRAQLISFIGFLLAGVSCDKRDSVTNNSGGTVTDIDGNVYKTVKIGNQVWTEENWRATKYDDGTALPLVTDSAAWCMHTTQAYCYYKNTTDADSIRKFGALYNWHVVNPANPKKIAPAGWHVPDDAEWKILENYLIANGFNWDGTTTANKIAKSMAVKSDWYTYTGQGTIGNDLINNNRSGFSALPCGFRLSNGSFHDIGRSGYWWSGSDYDASYACNRYLVCSYDFLLSSFYLKSCGFSVRLLRDSN